MRLALVNQDKKAALLMSSPSDNSCPQHQPVTSAPAKEPGYDATKTHRRHYEHTGSNIYPTVFSSCRFKKAIPNIGL